MEKVLTISICAYNGEKYIEECINSIVANPNCNDRIEVIVVNDGSTDDTSLIAHKCADLAATDLVKVIDKKNGGQGSAYNCGIQAARGKYIILMDVDDKINASKLDSVLATLAESNSDIVYTNYLEFNDAGEYVGKCSNEKFENGFLKYGEQYDFEQIGIMQGGAIFSIHNMILSIDFIRKNKISANEDFKIYNDVAIALRSSIYAKKFTYLNENLYEYRVSNEQCTSLFGFYRWKEEIVKMVYRTIDLYEDETNSCSKIRKGFICQKAACTLAHGYICALIGDNVKEDIYKLNCRVQKNSDLWKESTLFVKIASLNWRILYWPLKQIIKNKNWH